MDEAEDVFEGNSFDLFTFHSVSWDQRTRAHRIVHTSFRQILPIAALKNSPYGIMLSFFVLVSVKLCSKIRTQKTKCGTACPALSLKILKLFIFSKWG